MTIDSTPCSPAGLSVIDVITKLGSSRPSGVAAMRIGGVGRSKALRRRTLAFRAPLRWYASAVAGVPLMALVGSAFGAGLLDRLHPGGRRGIPITIPLLAVVGILVIADTHRGLAHRPSSLSSSAPPTPAPDLGHITRTGDQS